MEGKRMTYGESRLMNLIWEFAPISSTKLTELCRKELGWKKSTSYTMLKRLVEKGWAKNENALVTFLLPRSEAQALESNYVLENSFSGSLPGFLVAFLGGKTISREEAEELKRLIDAHKEG